MPADTKLLAEWFWVDRWMGSSAFLLPIEQRGLYREMLSQAWRRGAQLPNDHAAIRRAIGATVEEWNRCWPMVERYWRIDGDRLLNDTQLEIYAEAVGKVQVKSQAGKRGNQARWGSQNGGVRVANGIANASPPSPSPTPTPKDQERKSVSAEPSNGSTPSEKPVLTFPTIGPAGNTWQLSEAQLAEWATLFPGLEVEAEARKALAWIRAHESRRKTAAGMPRFLVGWFSRSVDRVGGRVAAAVAERPVWQDCTHEPRCNSKVFCLSLRAREEGRV